LELKEEKNKEKNNEYPNFFQMKNSCNNSYHQENFNFDDNLFNTCDNNFNYDQGLF